MIKLLEVITLSLCPLQTIAQETLTGKVTDMRHNPVELANVVELNADSTFIAGCVTDGKGAFRMPRTDKAVFIKASYIGLKPKVMKIDQFNGVIMLEDESKNIGEVVVKASPRIYRMTGEGLTARIQNSVFGKMGSVNDVLAQLPFISVHEGNITVLGKGTPLIYLDNREIQDKNELATLRSEDIKDIQIITNPGSRYPSNVNAVIRITTIRKRANGLSGTVEWTGRQRRLFSQTDYLSLNYRKGGLDVSGMAYYIEDRDREKYNNTKSFPYNQTPVSVESKSTDRLRSRFFVTRGRVNYVSADNTLSTGAQYFFSRTIGVDFNSNTDNRADDMDGLHVFQNRIDRTNQVSYHYGNAYLRKEFAHKLVADLDLTYVNSHIGTDQISTETEDNTLLQIPSLANSDSQMGAERLLISKPTTVGTFSGGEEFTFTDNRQRFDMRNDEIAQDIPSGSNRSLQRLLSVFADYGHSWGRWSANLGLRYEFVSFDYSVGGIRQPGQSRDYHNLIPNLSLTYSKDDLSATLSFRSTIDRPSYQNLRANMSYNDRYTYEGGNPALQPAHIQDFGLMLNWKDVVLSADYKLYKDAVMFYTRPYEGKPVTVFSFMNNDFNNLLLMGSYSPTIGWWKPTVTLSGNFQRLSYNGMDYNSPTLTYAFKNVFTLPSNFLLNINMEGSSAGHDQTIYRKSNFTTSVGLSRQWGRWFVKLTANDLLRTNREAWVLSTNGITSTKWLKNDSRFVSLTLRYSFNPVKSKYQGGTSGNSEQNRL